MSGYVIINYNSIERDDILNKPKILFVCESFGGGTFSYLQELVSAVANDYFVFIAHSIRAETPDNYKSKFAEGVTFINLKYLRREINPINDYKAVRELKKIVDDINPTIIHLHSTKAGAIGRLAINTRKNRVYYTPHSYCFLMNGAGKIKKMVYYFMEALLAKTNCTTISCSDSEHRVTQKLTKRAEVVNNGVNTVFLDQFKDADSCNKDFSSITFFSISRICPQKRPEIFNELAEKFPQHRFIWIGDGPDRHVLTSPNITVTGWLDRTSALEIAMTADAFILPSLYEGLSISLLEAMYLEKVCIVSNVVGNKDVIRTGENGFLCDSIDDYVKAIEKVSDKKKSEEINRLKKNAKADVCEKYNTDVMKKAYIDIYSK